MNKTLQQFCLLLTAACSSPALAAIVYDESVDGELSGVLASATPIATSVGSNHVSGVVGGATFNSPVGRDIFTLEVQSGQQLAAVILQTYDSAEDQSFFAVEAGTALTSVTSAASLLGSALIGDETGAEQGDDVLDDLGNAFFGGAGFSSSLGPGSYTFWFQDTSLPDVNYTFDFQIEREVDATADADGDGDVDGNDFLVWQRGLGLSGAGIGPADGNFNNDSTVDLQDLNVWIDTYEDTQASFASTTIPNPTTAILALLAWAGLATQRCCG